MPQLLEKHLRDWIANSYRPNPECYLFTNPAGQPYRSDYVVKYGVHRAMTRLEINTPKGAHIGVHCLRHGVTTSLLESGTPIHTVTQLMRHGDSRVTLEHYSHIVSNADREESEKLSRRIGQNMAQLESESKLESTTVKTA